MGIYQLKPSFAGGELTPALYGRTDLQKYDIGAAKLQNAVVLRYGGVSRRGGFRYIAGTKSNNKARLIPFSYNAEQNYVLELTAGYIRVYNHDGLISGVEVETPYTASELATIKYTQSADMIFLVQPNHPPATLTRYAEDNWQYAVFDVKNGPFNDANTEEITITPSATTGPITLTASEDYFTEDMEGQLMRIGHVVQSQYVKGKPNTDTMEVTCVPGANVYVESFGFWNGSFIVSVQESDGTWTQLKQQSGNRSQNYNMTFENTADEIRKYKVTSTEFDTSVHEGEDSSQRGYVTIQSFSNTYDGIVEITAVSTSTSASATVVKVLGSTSATDDFALTAWSEAQGYPQAVTFFEDRLVFAGNAKHPQTYWASKTGDYNNFGVSSPQQDSDAVIGTLSNGQINGIKAIIAFGEMIMLTSGGEYRVSGGNGENFTPTSQQAKAQEYRGTNDLTPVVIGGRIVYVQRDGNTVRDLAYAYDVDKYTGSEVSLLASHLFEGTTITGLTYQQSPDSVVWCVRSDGVLLGMTYIKEQEVFAWHRHTTQGKFIDVCSIPGSDEDELWAVVERGTNYYVEKMETRSAVVFADSAYVYKSTTAKSSITGLTWLAGKAVSVYADGNKVSGMTVSSEGALTLENPAKTIVVGLEYDTVIQTLPIELTGNDGTWGSRKKRIQNMSVMFADTIGGLYGLDESHLDEIKWRTTEPYGTPVNAYSGKKKIVLPQANYEDTLQITIKQTDPFPMTVLAIIPEVLAGG